MSKQCTVCGYHNTSMEYDCEMCHNPLYGYASSSNVGIAFNTNACSQQYRCRCGLIFKYLGSLSARCKCGMNIHVGEFNNIRDSIPMPVAHPIIKERSKILNLIG